MNHSTEVPGLDAALGKYCKLGSCQRLGFAFLALEKANLKDCDKGN